MRPDYVEAYIEVGYQATKAASTALEYVNNYVVANALFWGVCFILCMVVPFIFALITTYSNITNAKEMGVKNISAFVIMPFLYLSCGYVVFVLLYKFLSFTVVTDPSISLANFFELNYAQHSQMLKEQGLAFMYSTLALVELLSAAIIYIVALMPLFLGVFAVLLSFIFYDALKVTPMSIGKIKFYIVKMVGFVFITTVFGVFWAGMMNHTMFTGKPLNTKFGEFSSYPEMNRALIKYTAKKAFEYQ